MNRFFNEEDSIRMGRALFVLAVVVALCFAMQFVNEVKAYGYVGIAPSTVNTISVTGDGNAVAVPNIATESFSAQDTAPTVAAAQAVVNKTVAAALSFLKTSGVADKDISTTDYSASPNYIYPCLGGGACPADAPKTPQIQGYTVSQSVTVKIRDTSAVGKIVNGLGAAGVTGLTGPTYTVDDPSAVQDDARSQAIDDAKAKAATLAQELGIRLGRIASYSENTGGDTPTPQYATTDMVAAAAPAAAQVPAGENKYTSTVTITYEIR